MIDNHDETGSEDSGPVPSKSNSVKQLPRILMLLSAAGLIALFFMPMWRITLIAPQYPDGVTMYIWINQIGGESASTLQNINILNHYVGMKYIEPESIPELTYFPYIIGIMAFLAIGAAAIDRPWAYLTWLTLMIILAILGLYDFYLWEYDYGHNLSPKAPIKIPGASFQPPLLGTRLILNFTAKSYPALGGYLAMLSLMLAGSAFWFKRKMIRA